jgi:hypothetical protein
MGDGWSGPMRPSSRVCEYTAQAYRMQINEIIYADALNRSGFLRGSGTRADDHSGI